MHKKLIPALLVVLALAIPGMAQAATHWYNITEGSKVRHEFAEGQVVPVWYFHPSANNSDISLTPVIGANRTVQCSNVEGFGTFENPVGGGAGTYLINRLSTINCTQTGYCPQGTGVALTENISSLPAVTFKRPNGYKFSELNMTYNVLCSGTVVATFGGNPLFPYWAAGRYEAASPPNVKFGGAPGSHFLSQYGDTGTLTDESGDVVRPEGEWPYLGDEEATQIIVLLED